MNMILKLYSQIIFKEKKNRIKLDQWFPTFVSHNYILLDIENTNFPLTSTDHRCVKE